jgi:hypothetical protein
LEWGPEIEASTSGASAPVAAQSAALLFADVISARFISSAFAFRLLGLDLLLLLFDGSA